MNLEYIRKSLEYIGTMYEFQKSEDKEVDEDMLNSIIEQVCITKPKFALTPEEIDRITSLAKYNFLAKQDDGVCLTDDYEHYDWYTERSAAGDLEDAFWSRYREYLKDSSSLSLSAINKLDFNMLKDLMNLIGDPQSTSSFNRRGLILGDVQSGKTSTYIGYICKAADAGYKVIILLTGTTENLRYQTQRRVEEGFVGFDISKSIETNKSIRVGVGRDGRPLLVTALTSREDDFVGNKDKIMTSLENSKVVLCIVKKNVKVLGKLYDWLCKLNLDEKVGKITYPMLMIDDEADNASINTNNEDENPTKVNESIRKLLNLFAQKSYVGFTATPFANIFIDPDVPDELFPENFIYVLPTPEQYIGASKIFYEEGQYHESLRYIEDAGMTIHDKYPFYAKHKKDWAGELPYSLTQAIYVFLLANAIRDLKGDEKEPRGMLINISRFKDVHKYIKGEVESIFQNIYRKIKFDLSADMNKNLLIPELAELYRLWQENYAMLPYSWDEIRGQLLDSCENIQIMIVNSSKEADKLDYEKNPDLRVIAIGGLSLSRGITIEGLLVSYFFRNTATYDVLLQMGRWFGYRFNYDEVFRIWCGRKSVEWYSEIAKSVDLLKRDLHIMRERKSTPRDFGLRVRNDSKELRITAPNKMKTASDEEEYITYYGCFLETHFISSDYSANVKNWNAIVETIEKQGVNPIKDSDKGCWVVSDVPKADIISLLKKVKIHESNVKMNMHDMGNFLDDVNNAILNKWDIVIVEGQKNNSMIPDMPGIHAVLRTSHIDKNDEDRIVIGHRGKLTTPSDALLGLICEEDETQRLMSEAMSSYCKKYLEDKKVPFEKTEPKDFPASTWFEHMTKRTPTIYVYYLQVPNTDNNQIFEEHPLGWVGLAIGIPNCGEKGEAHKYKVTKIYALQKEDEEESFEE